MGWYCGVPANLQLSLSQRSRSGMRGFLLLAARILISAALLYFALRGINFAAIQSRLTQISFGWTLLSVLATIFQVFLGALRWKEISVNCGAPLGAGQAFRYNMIGAFFNQTLPIEHRRRCDAAWLVKHTGAGWRAAAYSVLVDRAIGLIALAIIVVASLPGAISSLATIMGVSHCC